MSEIYQMPGHLIRRLQQISVSVFTERMRAAGHDLTPVQFAALSAIRDNPEVDQATLAGLIAYDPVTLSGVIDRLQKKGLVSRAVSPRDRRARVIALTPKGEKLLTACQPSVWALQDDILAGLTPEERQTFLALLSKAASAGNDQSRAPLRTREKG
jgi:DNA-binding MarR family transcriptional regulator